MNCPQCHENYAYQDGHLFICPMCNHEWTIESQQLVEEEALIKDSNGRPLVDGDAVTIIKDLKVGRDVIKQGTRVKNIKLLDEMVDDHDLLARVEGVGSIYLKSSVVKK